MSNGCFLIVTPFIFDEHMANSKSHHDICKKVDILVQVLKSDITHQNDDTNFSVEARNHSFTRLTCRIPSSPCRSFSVSLPTSLSTVINIMALPSLRLRLTCMVAILTLLAPKSVPICPIIPGLSWLRATSMNGAGVRSNW